MSITLAEPAPFSVNLGSDNRDLRNHEPSRTRHKHTTGRWGTEDNRRSQDAARREDQRGVCELELRPIGIKRVRDHRRSAQLVKQRRPHNQRRAQRIVKITWRSASGKKASASSPTAARSHSSGPKACYFETEQHRTVGASEPVAGVRTSVRRPAPGSPVIGRASLSATPQTTGSRRLSRVPRTTFRAFSAPIRRRVPQRPLLEQERFPWPSPSAQRLGSLFPRLTAGAFDDAYQGFTHVADRTIDPAPLRTQPLDHARGLRYRGPRRLPGPDSHRQAALNLSPLRHADLPFFMAPRQSRRTRGKRASRGRSLSSLEQPRSWRSQRQRLSRQSRRQPAIP